MLLAAAKYARRLTRFVGLLCLLPRGCRLVLNGSRILWGAELASTYLEEGH
jgi:hypothetical protein